MRGRASPSRRRGPTPSDTLGSSPPVARSFSPARLNAVGAGPGRTTRAGPSPLELRRARRPGQQAPEPPRGPQPSSRRGISACPQPDAPPPAHPAPAGRTSSSRSKNPRSTPKPPQSSITLPIPLDTLPLTLVSVRMTGTPAARCRSSHSSRSMRLSGVSFGGAAYLAGSTRVPCTFAATRAPPMPDTTAPPQEDMTVRIWSMLAEPPRYG